MCLQHKTQKIQQHTNKAMKIEAMKIEGMKIEAMKIEAMKIEWATQHKHELFNTDDCLSYLFLIKGVCFYQKEFSVTTRNDLQNSLFLWLLGRLRSRQGLRPVANGF